MARAPDSGSKAGRSPASNHSQRRAKDRVSVRGQWLPIPVDFLRSRAFAELSPHACKLLFELCAQMRANARGNGDLSAAPALMKPRGWTSKSTLDAALRELQDAGMVSITRRGHRRQCTLYAVTLWPLDCDLSKLEHGPGSYTTNDWCAGSDRQERPTEEKPAVWLKPRKREQTTASLPDGSNSVGQTAIGPPAMGEPAGYMPPPRGNLQAFLARYAPAAGVSGESGSDSVPPPRDTYLDCHLQGTAGATEQAPQMEPELA